jgi:hypothetical protein
MQGLGTIDTTTIGQIMLGYAAVSPKVARMMAPWMARMDREYGRRADVPAALLEGLAARMAKVPPKRTYQAILKTVTEQLNGDNPVVLTEDWLLRLVPESPVVAELQSMARYLRALLTRLGLTVGLVAKAIDLPEAKLTLVFLGVDPITPSIANLLADYLDGVAQKVDRDHYSPITAEMLLAKKPPGVVKGSKIVPRESRDQILPPSVLYSQYSRLPLEARRSIASALLEKIAADVRELASGSTSAPPEKLEPIDLLIAEIDRVCSLAGGDRQFVAAAMARSGSVDPENDLDFDPLLGILQGIRRDRELPLEREAYAIASGYLCRELFEGRFRRLAELLEHVGMSGAAPVAHSPAKKTRSKVVC